MSDIVIFDQLADIKKLTTDKAANAFNSDIWERRGVLPYTNQCVT